VVFSKDDRRRLMEAATEIADRASKVILEIYSTDFEVRHKDDASPITDADELAENLILAGLLDLLPGVAAIGEEATSREKIQNLIGPRFWLVDPIDGTKEFLQRNGEFTVNIALIDGGVPVIGVVMAPAMNRAFRACGPGTAELREEAGAWTSISVRNVPAEGATVVSSRSHGDPIKLEQLIKDIQIREHRTMGSSLKFCLIAEGQADIYPRYGPTSEWDTAAGHAILLGAGGNVRQTDGTELPYGKTGWRNPEFIARGSE
tara:strand:+ start:9284 stop:10066 length:783 start_codon:yes stop_codon:yes gene_type:complete